MELESLLAILNFATGGFSALSGGKNAVKNPAALREIDASNPILYVIGGLGTIAIGALSWVGSNLGIWGTMVFIAGSLLNGWLGAGGGDHKNWRFWTMNAYVVVASGLILAILKNR